MAEAHYLKCMPSKPLSRCPWYISRWLGYRASTPRKLPKYVVWIWSFIGAFSAMAMLQAVFTHSAVFRTRDVPSIVGSFAASAILCYGAIDAPLAQPRALIGGHIIASVIGVSIYKLFALSSRLDDIRWLSASLACALALVTMAITATTHPPAGATALLASTDAAIIHLGWYYIPVVLLSSALVMCVALVVNNVQRRYPVFWWKPDAAPPASVAGALGSTQSVDLTNNMAGVDPMEIISEAENKV